MTYTINGDKVIKVVYYFGSIINLCLNYTTFTEALKHCKCNAFSAPRYFT
jgi:hypothetical protein